MENFRMERAQAIPERASTPFEELGQFIEATCETSHKTRAEVESRIDELVGQRPEQPINAALTLKAPSNESAGAIHTLLIRMEQVRENLYAINNAVARL